MAKKGQIVAVLGASAKTARYSNKAVKMLFDHGHSVIPVNPAGTDIHGISSVKTLDEIDKPVDTLTVYVKPDISLKLCKPILKLNPKRVIFNPGTENFQLEKLLTARKIETVHACTLVMLQTGQFEA